MTNSDAGGERYLQEHHILPQLDQDVVAPCSGFERQDTLGRRRSRRREDGHVPSGDKQFEGMERSVMHRKPRSAPPPSLTAAAALGVVQTAKLIAHELEDVAAVEPWWTSDAFRPMASTLSSLVDRCRDFYDFGLFLLTPDDHVVVRGTKARAPRDNVWFELGLFLGTLRERRTFAIQIETDRDALKARQIGH
jgi:Predicted nucleotide-binding protein containing TIR-like domain